MTDSPSAPASPASPATPASPPSPPEPPSHDDGPVLHAINELKTMFEEFVSNAQTAAPVQGEQPDATPQGVPWTHRGGRF